MRIVIFAMGPGETSQAYAVAKECKKRGFDVIFALYQGINSDFLADDQGIKKYVCETVQSLTDLVEKHQVDAVLLCNSKSFGADKAFQANSPFPNIPTFSLDSNWLFNDESNFFTYVKWCRKYYINLPEAVYVNGLKENGGYFNISDSVKKQIKVVGLIPSYEELSKDVIVSTRHQLKVEDYEKLIFCYFSGFGTGGKNWIIEKLVLAVSMLQAQGKKVKVIFQGRLAEQDINLLNDYTWAMPLSSGGGVVDLETFYRVLSSSDLVFQHQGLGTLAQSICARVPVIANVVSLHDTKNGYPQLHKGEVEPFVKTGVCDISFRETESQGVAHKIDELLFNPSRISLMKSSQEKMYSRGEVALVDDIIKTIAHE